jgi:hypothetical protein
MICHLFECKNNLYESSEKEICMELCQDLFGMFGKYFSCTGMAISGFPFVPFLGLKLSCSAFLFHFCLG